MDTGFNGAGGAPTPGLGRQVVLEQQQVASRSSLLFLLFLCLLLYLPGLGSGYFGDDYKYLFDNPREHILTEFVRPNPGNPVFWRPIQSTLLAVQQVLAEQATWPCQILQFVMHCGLVLTVFLLCRQLGASGTQCLLASAFTAMAHVGAQAVLGVDTLSQTGSTLFLALAALHLMMASQPDLAARRRLFLRAMAIGAFGLALLMKETGVAGLPILALIACWGHLTQSTGWRPVIHDGVWKPAPRAGGTAGTVLALMLVFAVYLVWRSMVVERVEGHEERYGISMGMNVLRNMLLLVGAVFVPVSPHRIMLWRDYGWLLPVIAAVVSLLVPGMMWIGMRLMSRRMILAVGILLLACFPAALLGKVTEVYAYNLLPAAAVLFGLAVGALVDRRNENTGEMLVAHPAAGVLVVLFLGLHGWSLHEKARLMAVNGVAAAALRQQVVDLIRESPAGAELVLVDAARDQPHYSVLIIPGLRVLSSAWPVIMAEADRPDVTIRQVTHFPSEISPGSIVHELSPRTAVAAR